MCNSTRLEHNWEATDSYFYFNVKVNNQLSTAYYLAGSLYNWLTILIIQHENIQFNPDMYGVWNDFYK